MGETPFIDIDEINKRSIYSPARGIQSCPKCGGKLLSTGMCSNLMCDYTAKYSDERKEDNNERIVEPEWITGTEEELIQRVKKDPWDLRFIQEQTSELCLQQLHKMD